MPNIFDNITPGSTLLPVLQHTIEIGYRADFCVGYFNLRGWRAITDSVEHFAGGDGNSCRVLIGMQSRPQDEFRQAQGNYRLVPLMTQADVVTGPSSQPCRLRNYYSELG